MDSRNNFQMDHRNSFRPDSRNSSQMDSHNSSQIGPLSNHRLPQRAANFSQWAGLNRFRVLSLSPSEPEHLPLHHPRSTGLNNSQTPLLNSRLSPVSACPILRSSQGPPERRNSS
jgi:hypothetical protein